MSDLISRQAAIDAITNTGSMVAYHDASESVLFGSAFRQNEIIDIIKALPSTDRPTGKWIDTEPDIPDASVRKGNKPYVCSVCGHSAGKYKYKTYKFCPWCGAKMEEGHE